MAKVEGSSLVAQAIAREGVETLFGLAGGPIQDIMGFAPHFGVRPIGVRHEQAAAFSAAAAADEPAPLLLLLASEL